MRSLFAEHHNHHNGGGEIVEHGRKEEGHKGHFPHQCALGAGVEGITHEVEPSIGIDDFHHRHGANQEEKGFGHLTQMLAQDVGGDKGGNTLARGFEVGQMKLRDVVGSTEGVEHPAGDSHEQSDGRFVDFQPVFEGDAEIAQHKNGYDDGSEHKGEKGVEGLRCLLAQNSQKNLLSTNFPRTIYLYLRQNHCFLCGPSDFYR